MAIFVTVNGLVGVWVHVSHLFGNQRLFNAFWDKFLLISSDIM